MKTLLNLVVILLATAGNAAARTPGNSAPSRPQNAYTPAPRHVQPSFQRPGPGYQAAATRQAHKRPGQRPALVVVNGGGYVCTQQEDTAYGQLDVVESAGGYNYRTSAVQANESRVQERAPENQEQNAEDKLQLRKTQAELREAESEKRMRVIRERNAARPRAAKPVSLILQPSGAVAWPTFLQDEDYSAYRAQVSQLFQQKARTGRVSADGCQQIAQMTEQIQKDLKANIGNMRPQDYLNAKTFLSNLPAELQSQPSPNNRSDAGGLVAEAKPAGE